MVRNTQETQCPFQGAKTATKVLTQVPISCPDFQRTVWLAYCAMPDAFREKGQALFLAHGFSEVCKIRMFSLSVAYTESISCIGKFCDIKFYFLSNHMIGGVFFVDFVSFIFLLLET